MVYRVFYVKPRPYDGRGFFDFLWIRAFTLNYQLHTY